MTQFRKPRLPIMMLMLGYSQIAYSVMVACHWLTYGRRKKR